MNLSDRQLEKSLEVLRRLGGTIRTAEALALGIHPRTFYALRDSGHIEKITRGVYRLADQPPLSNPDLVAAALRIPAGIVCLISALDFHDITSEIPHEVYLALPRNSRPPSVDYPPLRIFRFSGVAYSEGIEEHRIDGVAVKVYSAAKTIADCFRFRNRIGVGVAVEGLKSALEKKIATPGDIHRFASLMRVERIIQPYLDMVQ